ncbi:eukaryotic translation initiation factor 4E type 3 [Frankliniella occidentalis]|uniref:Eukaryotic translation initiation factor 4E type 3 n=1 Tax=Frankliniella occidentalis TaxID=133901 RepID=A0A6J1TQQ3_FRAOC|nr:eukaryotic translation initiation factor 4E type 3 [Frankliniella occidentalis]
MAATMTDPVDSSCDFSKSPVFSSAAINKMENQESDGVPLQTPWTFWLDRCVHGSSADEFQANLKKIYTVRTAQGFWAVFNNIPAANEINVRASYHLMREVHKPLWEEPYNRYGGTWRIKCQKRDTTKVWREMLVAAIGEQFSDAIADGDEICGVTVSIREREDLVQIWNINADLSDKATVIPRVHRLLPDVDFPAIFYKRHDTHQAFEKGRR